MCLKGGKMYKKHKKAKIGLTFCNSKKQRNELCNIVQAYIKNMESIWDTKIFLTQYDKIVYGTRKRETF